MNNCKKCKKNLKKDWKYCPYCGEYTRFKIKIPNFFSSKHEFEGNMEDMGREIEQVFSMMGFPMKVNVQRHNIQKLRPKKVKKIKRRKEKEILREVDKTIEPKASVKDMPNKTIIEVSLPKIESKKDINIRKLEESLEIRAYKGKTMYFKVIPLSKNSKIVEKSFKNKKLRLIFSK